MLSYIMDDYLDYIYNEKRLTKNSVEAYKRDIIQLSDYLKEINIESILDINKTTIITYMMYLQRNGRSSSTISRNLASIRCLFQYLINSNLIKEDPTLNLKSPKKEKKIPSTLTVEEINKLINQPNTEVEKGSRDKAMLELLCATGLRVSEINSLNIEDVNFDLKYIKIEDEESRRIVPISNMALKSTYHYLTNYRTSSKDNDPLFINYNGSRLTRQGFWKIIKSYANKASIDKPITPQILRNSFAVHLIKNGADIKSVQEILGHTDISTTQVYSNIANKEIINEAYDKTHTKT